MKSLEDKAPRILYLDIETTPHMVYTWGLWNQNVAISQIVDAGSTLCFAASWADTPDEYYFHAVWHESGMQGMVEAAHELLDEADAVVHFNGKKFDIPTLNREFLLHQLTPPSDYYQIDLYQAVRSNFKFASNKLDYVAQRLGIGSKLQHKGMELWIGCMAGNQEDLDVMEAYNIQDIELLPELYKILLPWLKQHPNMGLWKNSIAPTCTKCGSHELNQRGYRTTAMTIYPRFRCMDCGSWSRGRSQARKRKEGLQA